MKIYCKNKHWKLDEEYDLDKILYLLVDRPTRINIDNNFTWKNEVGEWHRDYDLPAYISYNNGYYIEWCKNGQDHRNDNKPAIIHNDSGTKIYYINGQHIKTDNKPAIIHNDDGIKNII